MRDIKFRAWGPNCKMMWNWAEVQQIANNLGWENFTEGERVLMQYAGQKDKNGAEIYERDIIEYWDGTLVTDNDGDIKYEGNPNRYSVAPAVRGEVVFVSSAFRVKGENPLGSAYIGESNIKVIGNIHQNPELLEAK